ncbi:MAG: acetyl-CoA acetyltransferase, partial [Thaumarchaeota archaeon]|nr:acetyl-CoA acetyltransferase [Nitrososphaerota archaeon]
MTVYVSKVGFTKVGDHWAKSITDLAFEASKKILETSSENPDALIVANAYSEVTSSQSNLGPVVADALGLENVRAFTIESSGASGASAIQVASDMIAAKKIRSALVIGVEKMRDVDPLKLLGIQGLAENAEYSQFFGISFTSLNAHLTRLYMSHYDISREKLSAFPVIAHKNSATAEHAQFKKKFSAEEVSRSEMLADPIRVLDCAPVGDGAASVLLVDESV